MASSSVLVGENVELGYFLTTELNKGETEVISLAMESSSYSPQK
jgi:hypothetical protein